MTKLRTPESVEDACTQAKALLGADAIATALTVRGLRCSGSLVDKWCDADAAQKPSLEQALAVETLLVKSGHAPIFGELFARLLPRAAVAEEAVDPLREAMRATHAAAELMEKVDASMIDGHIDRAEANTIERITHRAQQHLARLRRAVRKRLCLPKQR